MSDDHSIRSFREVLRAWKSDEPERSVREIREDLAICFTEALISAINYNLHHGPRKDTNFLDNKRVLDEIGVRGKKRRAHALAQMRALDRLHLKGHAQTTKERVSHFELLVTFMSLIPHFGEATARKFVEVFFYEEESNNKRIRGWQRFCTAAQYWVFTGKYFSALRRAHM